MNLFEIDYTSNAAHELRLELQQKQIMNALHELSIQTKSKSLQTPELKEDSLPKKNHTVFQSKNVTYSPYMSLDTAETISNFTRKNDLSHSKPSKISIRKSTLDSSKVVLKDSLDNNNDRSSYNKKQDPELRDIYGFKKPTQWVDIKQIKEAEHSVQSAMEKQRKKWQDLSDGVVLNWVKYGVPREMRPELWTHYSNTKCKIDASPNLYSSLSKKAVEMGKSNEYAIVIQKDLHRTFPDNPLFVCHEDSIVNSNIPNIQPTESKIHILKRVLLAFSVHSPDIGYCQSFNFLTGLLIILFEEEQAFWMLHTIVYDFFPEHMFDTNMEGANIEQTVLAMLIYEKMPGVWAKIASRKCFWECVEEECLPPITLVTNHWFMTLFINILPVETVLHIWDCFFAGEGFTILYKVALTIIRLNEESIWAAEDSIEAFQILQNMPKKLIDSQDFMSAVLSPSGIGSDVKNHDIGRRRNLFYDRKRERKNRQRQKI